MINYGHGKKPGCPGLWPGRNDWRWLFPWEEALPYGRDSSLTCQEDASEKEENVSASEAGMIIVRIGIGLVGSALVVFALVSAVKTFVLPRGINVWLTRVVFHWVQRLLQLRTSKAPTYEERDRVMAAMAPTGLLLLPLVFLALVLLGYACLFWALDPGLDGLSLFAALKLSGSSLLTLGYASVDTGWHKVLEFSEAMIGLILVALLIAYLPTMYAAFTKREAAVALLEGRAGSPPTAAEMISRSYRTGELETLRDLWLEWQQWFAELEESHTSLAPLAFFRSPQPERSWVTASGTVLDTAALMLALVDVPPEPQAAFCIRQGYLALRRIADFFAIPYDPDPAPDDPVSINRAEFEEVCRRLAAEGVPLKADREGAWRDFAGWRVNYDAVLLRLAALTMAPYAPWSSDRSAIEAATASTATGVPRLP